MDDLNRQITTAIEFAERMESSVGRVGQQAKDAWAHVSELEEQAAQHATSARERNVGRRGAIRAAIKAGNLQRAKMLVTTFEDKPDLDRNTNGIIRDLVAHPEQVWFD